LIDAVESAFEKAGILKKSDYITESLFGYHRTALSKGCTNLATQYGAAVFQTDEIRLDDISILIGENPRQ